MGLKLCHASAWRAYVISSGEKSGEGCNVNKIELSQQRDSCQHVIPLPPPSLFSHLFHTVGHHLAVVSSYLCPPAKGLKLMKVSVERDWEMALCSITDLTSVGISLIVVDETTGLWSYWAPLSSLDACTKNKCQIEMQIIRSCSLPTEPKLA